MRKAPILLLLGSMALGGSFAAEATLVEPMTLGQMARRADTIFVGRLIESTASWNSERTRIYTYARFQVDRALKGNDSGELTLRFLGGRVGRNLVVVPGTPRFTPGEEVLVFAVGRAPRVPTVLGASLGKFSVIRHQGEAILKRDISGLIFARHRTDARAVGAPPTRFTLSEVEAVIASTLAGL